MTRRGVVYALSVGLVAAATLSAQSVPPPKPFPTAGPPVTTAKPPAAAASATSAAKDWTAISPLLASIPAYQAAEFLESVDIGRNQRVFVFGTNDAYAGVVAFYKTRLRKSGDEVAKRPAIHQFDVASFDGNAMDQRPSVIVKDYTEPDPTGYVHVDGTIERRFKTIIQIIPSVR